MTACYTVNGDNGDMVYSTKEAADILGISYRALNTTIVRYPNLKPIMVGHSLVWDDESIERVRAFRDRPEARGGRPKQSEQ